MRIKSFIPAKYSVFFGIIFVLFLATLFIIAFLAKNEGKENILVVSPSKFSSPGINTGKIEEFMENNFLLTYELHSSEKISLAYADFPVKITAVNSCYPQLTGTSIIEGAFFSKQVWSEKLRHAVLNETAAFTIFGSTRITGNRFKINADTWLVTGVISDANDDSVIYIPSSIYNISNSEAYEFLVLMSPSLGFDETYIKNSLKTLGIHDNYFNYYNLGSQLNLLFERPLIILLIFLALFLLFLFAFFIEKFKMSINALKIELDRKYAHELFSQNRKTVFKSAIVTLHLICCPSLALFFLIRAVTIILPWQDIPSLYECMKIFYPHIEKLYNFELASRIIFLFSLILLSAFIIIGIFKRFIFRADISSNAEA